MYQEHLSKVDGASNCGQKPHRIPDSHFQRCGLKATELSLHCLIYQKTRVPAQTFEGLVK